MSINGIGRPRNWNLTDETDDPNYRQNMRAANHWRNKAERSCERHLKAMRLEFSKLAYRERITPFLAQAMLMNATEAVPCGVARRTHLTANEESGNFTLSHLQAHRLVDGQ